MAKKFPPGKCVHCLEYFDNLTSDHVFPKSWYPDTTPNNLEKWQIPSCKECNARYGKLEQDLLLRLGLCIDPKNAASSGIANKILRSTQSKYGRNEKDKKIRQKTGNKLKQDLIPVSKYSRKSFLPGFSHVTNANINNLTALLISVDDLEDLCKKLIKGITFIQNCSYIDNSYIVEIFALEEKGSSFIIEIINKYGAYYHRGPGIKIGIARVDSDQNSSCYEIVIWNQIKMYGIVTPKEKLRKP